ncbi:transferase [Streptomyces sp. NBC_01020]|uniref:transferase n=1 Tax=unclassified Streptomyces TaxID=2593676 RepID=UPI002E1E6536|nr:transferase [Streptomyces sp. NBC_01020]WSX70690.1 transferase [Streptomyces sp. NBC_00932]
MTGTSEDRLPYAVDCTADADGTIGFAVAAAGPTALVLKRRKSGDRVRLALTESPDGGSSGGHAVLDAAAELREGRWDVFTEGGPAGEQRVEPGLRDLRKLTDRTPHPAATAVVARIPYRTADGMLAVRSWSRSPHAEAGELTVRPGALSVAGQLYGAGLGADAVVEARLRGAPGQVHREPVRTGGDDGAFSCTLHCGPLAVGDGEGARFWDLWLLPEGAEGSGPGVRISRILDDIADRKSVFVYPGSPCGDGAVRAATATPYYTVDNDLSVRLDPPRG